MLMTPQSDFKDASRAPRDLAQPMVPGGVEGLETHTSSSPLRVLAGLFLAGLGLLLGAVLGLIAGAASGLISIGC